MISAGATPTVAMTHKMGLAKLDMTTGKQVPTTRTYTFNNSDGSATISDSSGKTTIKAHHAFNTASNYCMPLYASTANSDCFFIVKSNGDGSNASSKFGCGVVNTTEYWSDVTVSDIGYGKYATKSINSDRPAAGMVANFAYVGTCQTFTLPWYGSYKFECWGGKGGSVQYYNSSANSVAGGIGGYVAGKITLGKMTLYVYVGQAGGDDVNSQTRTFNGGGINYWYGHPAQNYREGRGGGATDIRITKHSGSDGWSGAASLRTRIIVGGGGGGATNYGSLNSGDGSGGHAGGLIGYPSKTTYIHDPSPATNATGGTQTAGGNAWKWENVVTNSNPGAFGMGGNGTNNYPGFGAGGGSGWYGGGGGGVRKGIVSSGAGGSSFISGHPGCNGWNNQTGNHAGVGNPSRILVGSTYTTFTFTNCEMIDGNGLLWVGNQSSGSGSKAIPSKPNNNGYAKITSQ